MSVGPIAGRWSDPKCLFPASLLTSKVSLLPKLPQKKFSMGFHFRGVGENFNFHIKICIIPLFPD